MRTGGGPDLEPFAQVERAWIDAGRRVGQHLQEQRQVGFTAEVGGRSVFHRADNRCAVNLVIAADGLRDARVEQLHPMDGPEAVLVVGRVEARRLFVVPRGDEAGRRIRIPGLVGGGDVPLPVVRAVAPRRQIERDAHRSLRAPAGMLIADRRRVDVEPVERVVDPAAGRAPERVEAAVHRVGVVEPLEPDRRLNLSTVGGALARHGDRRAVLECAAIDERSVIARAFDGPRERRRRAGSREAGRRVFDVLERVDGLAFALVLVSHRRRRDGPTIRITELEHEVVDVVGPR